MQIYLVISYISVKSVGERYFPLMTQMGTDNM